MKAMSESKIKFHPTTRRAVDEYVKRVAAHEKDNLLKIILFGSVARGETDKNSDIDLLVVLKERSLEDIEEICGISAGVKWDMDFDENAYIQPLPLSEKETQGLEFYGLMNNVNREGIVLYDSHR